jgi:phosphoenolpyruvate carboxylase
MSHLNNTGLQPFNDLVGLKFQLYNSLFTSLPFHKIEKTGILLSLLLNDCEEGYKKGKSPSEILNDFFGRSTACRTLKEKTDLLFVGGCRLPVCK